MIEHRFTNAYRAADRVSQYLIRNVIYGGDLPDTAEEILFRILLFKLFNRIETWTLLESSVGPITLKTYDFDRYDAVLTAAIEQGKKLYSAAYIMPSGLREFGQPRKHRAHLKLIELMIGGELPKRLATVPSLANLFDLLIAFPTIGPFLAYQLAIDINYSELVDFSEMEFVVPGPGARDGIRKCFTDLGDLTEQYVIRWMAENQDEQFKRLGLRFPTLFGRSLQLIDCQNLFCEVDKYARVMHPDIPGRTGRKRIKQKFVPKVDELALWFPPKWNLNGAVPVPLAQDGGR